MKFIQEYKGYKIYYTNNKMYKVDDKDGEYKTIGGAKQSVTHFIKDINTNEYILYNDYAEIVIISKKFGVFKTQIDLDDVERCEPIVWNVNKCYHHKEEEYYIGSSNKEATLLHRFILDNPKDLNVDHIDGKTFNNRKSNLRPCTPMGNGKNRKMNRNNKSGFKGVCWDKSNSSWLAHICIDNKKTVLGYFNNFEDAVKCRIEAERKYYKDFSRDYNRDIKLYKEKMLKAITKTIKVISVENKWGLYSPHPDIKLEDTLFNTQRSAYNRCRELYPNGKKVNCGYLVA